MRAGSTRVDTRLRTSLVSVCAALLVALSPGCGGGDDDRVSVPGVEGASKTSATLRAARRAYDGAPPVIPHAPFGAACTSCHTLAGMSVPDVGFAPPSPHNNTDGLSLVSRCEQCHVWQVTDELFVENGFEGIAQDLRDGARAHDLAPPTMPHSVFMRENCTACHSGPAAREEIRTDHPERQNCQQCHIPQASTSLFARN